MSLSPRILIIDDHPVVLAGCRKLLAAIPGAQFDEARSIAAAKSRLTVFKPSLIIVDVNLPDGSGIDFARSFLAGNEGVKIIIFTMSDSTLLALQAFDAGISGFVSKTDDPEQLMNAVEKVLGGEQWISEALIQEMALMRTGAAGTTLSLSERDTAILRALVRGRSLAEIAKELDISYKTVATYCAGLRTKLGARTTSELVRIAMEMRLT